MKWFLAPLLFCLPTLPVWAQSRSVGTTYYVHQEDIAPLRGTLRAGGKNFLVEPVQLVTDSGVREITVTPDGSRVVVLRETYRPTADSLIQNANQSPNPSPGEASLIVWNAVTRKSNTVWRMGIAPGDRFAARITGTLHGPQGDRILVWVTLTRTKTEKPSFTQSIVLIDSEKSIARQVNIPLTVYAYTNASPTVPFAALYGPDGATDDNLRFLRPDGSITAPITFQGTIFWTGWHKNGTVLRGIGGDKVNQWFEANPQTGTLAPIKTPSKEEQRADERVSEPAPETLPQLALTSRPPLPLSGTRTPSVWLQAQAETPEKPKESVLLCAEGRPVFLLPRAALFLSSDGALFAAPIQSVSDTAFAEVRRKLRRDADLRDVSRIGIALFGYVFKNDDTFPAGAGDFSAALAPYLGDPAALSGFVYLPPPSLALENIKEAKNNVIGYKPGDGGKTVLFADGHAAWQDDALPQK